MSRSMLKKLQAASNAPDDGATAFLRESGLDAEKETKEDAPAASPPIPAGMIFLRESGDERAGEMAENARLREQIRELLVIEMGRRNERPSAELIDLFTDATAAIKASNRERRTHALVMGRWITRMKDKFEGGYRAIVRAGLINVSESDASKFQKIAALVDAGIDPDLLPRSGNACYALAQHGPDMAKDLIEKGLLRPDMTQAQVESAIARETREPDDDRVDDPPTYLTKEQRRRLERRFDKSLKDAAEAVSKLQITAEQAIERLKALLQKA